MIAAQKRRLVRRLVAIDRHALPLVFLVAADFVFIALHVVHILGIIGAISENANFAIDRDRGYAEVYEYIKMFWIALGLGGLAWRQQQVLYGLGGLLFAFLAVDNIMELHEQLGAWSADAFALEAGAHVLGSDMVQIAYWGSIGIATLLVGWRFYRRADPSARRLGQRLLLGLAGLAVFGVAVDTLHSIVGLATGSVFWDELLAVVEDGGELVVMSWICAVVLIAIADLPPISRTPG